jgi:hypothetical protein
MPRSWKGGTVLTTMPPLVFFTNGIRAKGVDEVHHDGRRGEPLSWCLSLEICVFVLLDDFLHGIHLLLRVSS